MTAPTSPRSPARQEQPKRKYGNKPTIVDGISFPSKREAKRYGELRLREQAGEIENLTLQPRFPIDVNGRRICTYVGDFEYYDRATGDQVVEDAKGFKTPLYRLKKKLVAAVWNVKVLEV